LRRRAEFDRSHDCFPTQVGIEERAYLRQFSSGVLKHVLIAEGQEIAVALPESKPAAYVIIPTTVAFHRPGEVAGEEARNILLDATIVCDGPSL
jgi:hypothetical protein